MNDIREIVTKAVIGKGKKRFKITSPLNDLRSPADSILGCWIINHKFGARKCDNSVDVKVFMTLTCGIHLLIIHKLK